MLLFHFSKKKSKPSALSIHQISCVMLDMVLNKSSDKIITMIIALQKKKKSSNQNLRINLIS